MKNDKFYVDYDEETATYCIFDIETGKAYGGYTDENQAQKECDKMNHKDKIYYVSQYDNSIHNINDVEYQLYGKDQAYIGINCGTDGFRVDEEVDLHTIDEIIKLFK